MATLLLFSSFAVIASLVKAQSPKWIYVRNQTTTWIEAEAYCAVTYGTHLASWSTVAEALELQNLVGSPFVWIGLNDRGTNEFWEFSDGSVDCAAIDPVTGCAHSANFDFWNVNEPSGDSGTNNDCAHTFGLSNIADWLNDFPCDSAAGLHKFVCNAPFTTTAPTTSPTTTDEPTSAPTTAAPATAAPTTIATLPDELYNVTIVSDELPCQEIVDVIVPAVYAATTIPIIINVTTECDGNETIPVQLLITVPAGASLNNETTIVILFVQVIYEVYEVIDVVIIVNRIISPQPTDSEEPPLLSIEWWIAIGVGGLCLLIGVCAVITSVLRKQPSVVNNNNVTINADNYNDNRGAQITMVGTAAVGAQKDQDKKTKTGADAGEEDKVIAIKKAVSANLDSRSA